MANIGFGYVSTIDDYINLEDAVGVTLETGKTYTVQVMAEGKFCESSTKPVDGGTNHDGSEEFYYKKKAGEFLWAKLLPNKTVYVNFAE